MSLLGAQVGGWDPATIVTAVLAGIAAVAGLASIVMNWIMQRDQQQWQEKQEDHRRKWESRQERDRRKWQERWETSTRWDEHKQRLYVEYLSHADRLFEVSDDLADVRRALAEDLANHMAMVEEYYRDHEGERIRAMDADERDDFWRGIYEEQLAWYRERRATLNEAQAEAESALRRSLVELHLIAPEGIRDHVGELARLSHQTHYGISHGRDQERASIRAQFIEAVRDDLRVPAEGGP